MSHDIQAAWAASEIAYLLTENYSTNWLNRPGDWSFYASREVRREWPIADGVIIAENATTRQLKLALEYKRQNEGVHGVLTALGQSLAYINKGFSGSIIVIPNRYDTHNNPGEHINRIIDRTAPNVPVTIYTYDQPDTTTATPFRNRLRCIREIRNVENENTTHNNTETNYVKTLWMHLREGSSDPDAFFRYCQVVKQLNSEFNHFEFTTLPQEITDSVERQSPGADPYKYLSNTVGDTILDNTWRVFWFTYIFNNDTIPLYNEENGSYTVNSSLSKIRRSDGNGYKAFNVGKSNSPKNKAVLKMNNGEWSEEQAWDYYVERTRARAHSYREDIDSGLAGIGFLEGDGRLTELGYKFVDACERIGNPNTGIAKAIFSSSILQNGQLSALLYYIYKLSEREFHNNPLAFTVLNNGRYTFNQNEYKLWLEDKFQNELYIIRKVTARGGQTRQPFQAELAILRNLGYVKGFRVGVGLEINWPEIQNSLNYFSSL